jgi:hypothetical protein
MIIVLIVMAVAGIAINLSYIEKVTAIDNGIPVSAYTNKINNLPKKLYRNSKKIINKIISRKLKRLETAGICKADPGK